MRKDLGFVFIELVVVLGILSVLFGLATVNVFRLLHRPPVVASMDVLTSDLRSAQIRAMIGETNGVATTDFGVVVETVRYILFAGSVYNAADGANVVTTLPTGVTASTTFPNGQLVFSRRSGDIAGFINGQNTITLRKSSTTEQQVIQINRFGAVVGVQ